MHHLTEPSTKLDQRQYLVGINYFMISLMLACFAYLLGQAIHYFYLPWNPTGFSFLAFIIALESLIMRHKQRAASQIIDNPLLSTVSELVILLLFVKIFSLLMGGLSTIWVEISAWQVSFIQNFFNTNYIIYIFGSVSVWGIAFLYSIPLTQFEEDEKLLEQEKLGYTFNDRLDARRQITQLIFIVGFIMLIIMVALTSEMTTTMNSISATRGMLAVLLLYFFAGFILLALNQYVIMKARWYFNDIDISPNFLKPWVFYAASLVLIVMVTILFLPTNFTLGFQPLARMLSQAALFLLSVLQFLIVFPFALLFALFNAISKGEPIGDQIQQSLPEITPEMPQAASAAPWLELVKSIIFWLVFLGLIIFSISYTIKNRGELRSFFEMIKIRNWMNSLWEWLKIGFNKISSETTDVIQNAISGFQNYLNQRAAKLPSLASLTYKVPPRQAVILIYIDWINWNHQHGFSREISQTPIEYANSCMHQLPEAVEIINAFTKTFMMARYTKQVIDPSHVEESRSWLGSLKKAWQQKEKQEKEKRS